MFFIKKMPLFVRKCRDARKSNEVRSIEFRFSALTERIVLVLSRMKCPHAIEPFQIQGEDFIHIFPVVQWLVKRVFERRAEIGDFNRAYTLSQYEKTVPHLDETVDQNAKSFQENIEQIRVSD